jgi:hypothetical protein
MKSFYGWMIVAVLTAGSAASAQTLQGGLDAIGSIFDSGSTVNLGPVGSGPLIESIGVTDANVGAAIDFTSTQFNANTTGAADQYLFAGSTTNDELTITALGTTVGQAGFAVITFEVTGSVAINTDGVANADNYAEWILGNTVSLGFGGSAYETGNATDTGPFGDPFGNFTTALIPIEYGVPLPLIIATTGEFEIVSQGTIESSVTTTDLRIEWGGAQLYDDSFNLLEDGAITGLSGTNYPVPEPAAVGAIGLLLASLASRRRRRPVA